MRVLHLIPSISPGAGPIGSTGDDVCPAPPRRSSFDFSPPTTTALIIWKWLFLWPGRAWRRCGVASFCALEPTLRGVARVLSARSGDWLRFTWRLRPSCIVHALFSFSRRWAWRCRRRGVPYMLRTHRPVAAWSFRRVTCRKGRCCWGLIERRNLQGFPLFISRSGRCRRRQKPLH